MMIYLKCLRLSNVIYSSFYNTTKILIPLECNALVFRSTSCEVSKLANCRFYCDKRDSDCDLTNNKSSLETNKTQSSQIGLESKYKVFQDCDAPILLDVYEEKLQLEQANIDNDEEESDEFSGINLQRGERGVYNIEDLIHLLRRDKAEDIFVAELPPEARYVDHIVIVTGRSRRHMTALAEIVRRIFKKKRWSTDPIPQIEGETSTDWMALDLGNIALHIFSRNARSIYDLESLWSVGPEFDPLVNVPDDALTALMKEHSISYHDFHSKGKLL